MAVLPPSGPPPAPHMLGLEVAVSHLVAQVPAERLRQLLKAPSWNQHLGAAPALCPQRNDEGDRLPAGPSSLVNAGPLPIAWASPASQQTRAEVQTWLWARKGVTCCLCAGRPHPSSSSVWDNPSLGPGSGPAQGPSGACGFSPTRWGLRPSPGNWPRRWHRALTLEPVWTEETRQLVGGGATARGNTILLCFQNAPSEVTTLPGHLGGALRHSAPARGSAQDSAQGSSLLLFSHLLLARLRRELMPTQGLMS